MATYTADILVISFTSDPGVRIEETFAGISAPSVTTTYECLPATLTISTTAMQGQTVAHICSGWPITLTINGAALSGVPITGRITADLPVIEVGTFWGNAVLEGSLPVITGSFTGSRVSLATLKADLPVITGSFTGAVSREGTLTATLPLITGTLEGRNDVLLSLNVTLPLIDGTLQGRNYEKATLAATLPLIGGALTGVLDARGEINVTLPTITGSFRSDSLVFSVLAMNLKNKGLSEYTNFPFNSMCEFNGKYYGCASDGIHVISASTTSDNGTVIPITLRTGAFDMEDDDVLKRIRHAFIGYKSSGDLTLSVITDDGTQYDYSLTSVTTNDNGQKLKFGKGLKDRYLAFQIQNVSGSTLELDKLRLFVEPVRHRRR